MPPGAHRPIMMPGPAFGDIQAGMHLARGIAATLFHRERTGEGSVVDVSLLGSGMWAMQAAIAGAYVTDKDELPRIDRLTVSNPLANVNYRTSDDRFIALSMWSRIAIGRSFVGCSGKAHSRRTRGFPPRRRVARMPLPVWRSSTAYSWSSHWTSGKRSCPSRTGSGPSCG
jgi:CoA-transferase family III